MKYYERFFDREQLQELKASEMRDMRKEEESLQVLVGGVLVSGFLTVITLIALLIWLNKITLFVFLVGALCTGTLTLLGYIAYKDYLKVVKRVMGRFDD